MMVSLTLVEAVEFKAKIDTIGRTTGYSGELNVEWEESVQLKIEF